MIFSWLEKLGGREKAFLVIGVVILLAALGDYFVAQPIVNRLHQMQSAIQIARERLAYNEAVLAGRDQVEPAYEEASKRLARITTSASDIDLMKGQIDDMAIRSRLEVVEVKHREPRPLPYYNEYIVDIAFQGTMQSLLTFLYALQQNDIPGLLSVDQLTVGVGRQEDTIKGAMTITKVAVDA